MMNAWRASDHCSTVIGRYVLNIQSRRLTIRAIVLALRRLVLFVDDSIHALVFAASKTERFQELVAMMMMVR